MQALIMSYATGAKLLILKHEERFGFYGPHVIVNPTYFSHFMPDVDIAMTLYPSQFHDRLISNYESVLMPITDSLAYVGGVGHEFDWRAGVDVHNIDTAIIKDYFASVPRNKIDAFINSWKNAPMVKDISFDPVVFAPVVRGELRRMVALASQLDANLLRELSQLRAVFERGVLNTGPVDKLITVDTFRRLADVYLSADGRYPKWLLKMLLHVATIFLGPNRDIGDAYLAAK